MITTTDSTLLIGDKKLAVRTFEPGVNRYLTHRLVFLHDALGSIQQWKDIPSRLCSSLGIKGFAIDRLNYGKSDSNPEKRTTDYLQKEATQILPQVLEQLAANKKNILVGHSDGGTIALCYAGFSPQNSAAVVSIAAHLWVEDITLKGIVEVEEKLKELKLQEKLEKYHGKKASFLLNGWIDTWKEMKKVDWNIFSFVKKIECPVLALQGRHDEYGSDNQLHKLHELAQGSVTLQLYEGVKHFPHLEQKEVVLKDIVSYIQTQIL